MVSVLAAGVLAGLLSAIQWLPGVEVLGTSQRATGSFAVFAYGSLPVAWLTLLVVPDLLGGSGSFGAPAFLGGVNFVEVTGYVGLAPLTAATSLLGRIRRRARRPEWLVWEVVAAVGALLALGSTTPLGPLLAHIPLYGGQRIQSRNLLEVDLALAFLLGFWLDTWLAAPTTKAQAAGRGGRLTTAVATALPGLAAAGLVMWSLVSAGGLLQGLGARAAHGPIPAGYYATVAPFLVIAVACVGLALMGPRLSGRRRATAMVSFVVIDLVVLTATSVVAVAGGPAPSSGSDPTSGGQGSIPVPIRTAGVSGVGATPRDVLRIPGRFAIYDPGLVDVPALNTAGEPDRNIWTGGYSVQGYSSLVDGVYAATTGSHAANGEGQNTLSPTAVGDSTLDQLDTSILLTPSVSLVGASGRRSPTGARSLHRGSVASWYLGTPHAIDSVSIPAHAGGSVAGAEIGLQSPGGSVTWHPAALRSGTLEARFPGRPRSRRRPGPRRGRPAGSPRAPPGSRRVGRRQRRPARRPRPPALDLRRRRRSLRRLRRSAGGAGAPFAGAAGRLAPGDRGPGPGRFECRAILGSGDLPARRDRSAGRGGHRRLASRVATRRRPFGGAGGTKRRPSAGRHGPRRRRRVDLAL